MTWCVYILECADGTLYTGISNHLDARISAHNEGKGAKYTAARRPVSLLYDEPAENRSEASKREARIKKMTRSQKLSLALKKRS